LRLGFARLRWSGWAVSSPAGVRLPRTYAAAGRAQRSTYLRGLGSTGGRGGRGRCGPGHPAVRRGQGGRHADLRHQLVMAAPGPTPARRRGRPLRLAGEGCVCAAAAGLVIGSPPFPDSPGSGLSAGGVEEAAVGGGGCFFHAGGLHYVG
jgi:hypothetical protein